MAKEMIVEKSVVIQQPKQVVFDYLKLVKNADNFSVWNMNDPKKKTTYTGTDGSVGFVYRWESEVRNVGIGEQEIMKIVDGDLIEYQLRFEKPMNNVGVSKFILNDAGDGQTQVIWDFRGPTKFPMSLFKGFFQKMLGKDISQSLENLKGILEK
ncbi:SRPBCC family protein [Jiulongibacter sp. NS-SX5]|uniref:SRPBCC family protein n=1 Tax=Jiulongibacter sp. NS-SX5 TaxID=3463854 RepID=UPI00405994D3